MNNTIKKYLKLVIFVSLWVFGLLIIFFSGVFINEMSNSYIFISKPFSDSIHRINTEFINPDSYYLYSENYKIVNERIEIYTEYDAKNVKRIQDRTFFIFLFIITIGGLIAIISDNMLNGESNSSV